MKRSLVLFASIAFASSLFAGKADKKLDIYWIDSEGGGSTLIVTPTDQSVLIDSGNPGGRDSRRIYKVAKDIAGLKRIDHYVNTHFHVDHFGGIAELAALMPIGTVWDNGIPDKDPDGNPTDTRWMLTSKPYREMKVEKRHVIAPGEQIPLSTGSIGAQLSLRCLGAKQRFIAPGGTERPNTLCSEAKE